MSNQSLRQIIKKTTGQDVFHCQVCQRCDIQSENDMDIPLTTLMSMVMFDDDEVLNAKTVWSDRVLAETAHACKRGLNLQKIILALRSESRNRGNIP